MKFYLVTFADGNTIKTGMNANLFEAREYYLGRYFQFGDTEECPHDHMVKAVKVDDIGVYGKIRCHNLSYYDLGTKIKIHGFREIDKVNFMDMVTPRMLESMKASSIQILTEGAWGYWWITVYQHSIRYDEDKFYHSFWRKNA